jgi:hypothetical protein
MWVLFSGVLGSKLFVEDLAVKFPCLIITSIIFMRSQTCLLLLNFTGQSVDPQTTETNLCQFQKGQESWDREIF